MSRAGDFFFDNFGWFLLGFVSVMLFLAVFAKYQEDKQPHIQLLKSDWACTNTQIIPVTTYVKSGDVLVPITTQMRKCIQWSMQP